MDSLALHNLRVDMNALTMRSVARYAKGIKPLAPA